MTESAWRGRRVLVTGGSGFFGSHLVRRLVAAGADVLVLTRYVSVVDCVRLAPVWEAVTPVEGDLRNPDALLRLRALQPEIVFHLAAYNHVGDSFDNVGEAIATNALGTANLMQAYADYGRFVYVSTSEVYGAQAEVPFTEAMQPAPISPYAVGKFSGELFARMQHHVYRRPVVVVRPFNAFGPYQSPRAVVAELIIRCLRGEPVRTTAGTQTRDLNYVENQVDGLLAAAQCDAAIGQVINLGSGREIAIRDLVALIHRLCDSSSPLEIGALPHRPTEVWRMAADSTRARQLLGWQPAVDLEPGLRATVAWYRRFLALYSDPASPLRAL